MVECVCGVIGLFCGLMVSSIIEVGIIVDGVIVMLIVEVGWIVDDEGVWVKILRRLEIVVVVWEVVFGLIDEFDVDDVLDLDVDVDVVESVGRKLDSRLVLIFWKIVVVIVWVLIILLLLIMKLGEMFIVGCLLILIFSILSLFLNEWKSI